MAGCCTRFAGSCRRCAIQPVGSPCGDRLCKPLLNYTANSGQGRHACCSPGQRVRQLGLDRGERRALAVLMEGQRQRAGNRRLALAVKRAHCMDGAGNHTHTHSFCHCLGGGALSLPHPPLADLAPLRSIRTHRWGCPGRRLHDGSPAALPTCQWGAGGCATGLAQPTLHLQPRLVCGSETARASGPGPSLPPTCVAAEPPAADVCVQRPVLVLQPRPQALWPCVAAFAARCKSKVPPLVGAAAGGGLAACRMSQLLQLTSTSFDARSEELQERAAWRWSRGSTAEAAPASTARRLGRRSEWMR